MQAKLLDEHYSSYDKLPVPGLADAGWNSLQPSRNILGGRATFQNSSLSVLAGEYQKQTPVQQSLLNANWHKNWQSSLTTQPSQVQRSGLATVPKLPQLLSPVKHPSSANLKLPLRDAPGKAVGGGAQQLQGMQRSHFLQSTPADKVNLRPPQQLDW